MKEIYLGSYTKEQSKGIHKIYLDEEKDELVNYSLFTECNNPTFVCKSDNAVYSIVKDEDKGGIAAFDLDGNLLNMVLLDGVPPCHLCISERLNMVFAVNYHKGEVTSYKINDDYSLELFEVVVHDYPLGPRQSQDRNRCHYVAVVDDYVLVCELGGDLIVVYDVTTGHLIEHSLCKFESGAGPRHLVVHPNKEIIYCICEQDNTVVTLTFKAGHLEIIDTVSTLPIDYTEQSYTAAIRLDKNSEYLYGSNRGHNSIVRYRINSDFKPTLVEWIDAKGFAPRDFNLVGDYMIIANQFTNNLVLYKIDDEVKLISDNTTAYECVCVEV